MDRMDEIAKSKALEKYKVLEEEYLAKKIELDKLIKKERIWLSKLNPVKDRMKSLKFQLKDLRNLLGKEKGKNCPALKEFPERRAGECLLKNSSYHNSYLSSGDEAWFFSEICFNCPLEKEDVEIQMIAKGLKGEIKSRFNF